MARNYIGLSCSPHDPSIAVVNAQGHVVFAEALERPLQDKRAWCSAPDHVMRIGGILAEHCDAGSEIVAATTWSRATALQQLIAETMFRLINHRATSLRAAFVPQTTDYVEYLAHSMRTTLGQTGSALRLRLAQTRAGRNSQVVFRHYDHHLTHAMAAAHSSPFEDAVCLVVDASGEFRAGSAYLFKRGTLTALRGASSSIGGSLGIFYTALCEACGFDSMAGEEWKVMGLAAYGRFNQQYYDLMRPLMQVRGQKLVAGQGRLRRFNALYALRAKHVGSPQAAADLAYTGQQVFCELYLGLIGSLHALGLSDNLVVTGGCALNSSANGRIVAETPFKALFVPSAPADDGNAVGAALLAHRDDHRERWHPKNHVTSPYLGSTMRQTALSNLCRFGGLDSHECEEHELVERVAQLLSQGKIVGWVQGKAEFGPRALGNRSILADPRSAEVKDRINQRIKFREEFRPFAPSILEEDGAQYFENYQSSPYMERTLRFTAFGKATVPGVVHADGTGRLQTVTHALNPRFYALLLAFKRITGVPVLLNTSFNVMGKPIVHSVEDAVSVLMTSGLDVLVIDRQLFQKRGSELRRGFELHEMVAE
jgi:carbamoyltransferase